MVITGKCAHCGQPFRVADQFAGQQGQCSGCKQIMMIPSPAATSAASEPAMIMGKCQHCGRAFQVKASFAGRQGQCTGCGQMMTIPTSPQASPQTTAAASDPFADLPPIDFPAVPSADANLPSYAAPSQPSPPTATKKKRKKKLRRGDSGCAKASLICGMLSFCLNILAGIPAVILAIVALAQIAGSEGRLKGTGQAIGGLLLGIAGPLFPLLLLMLLALTPPVQQRATQYNMEQIMFAMHRYDSKYRQLPRDITDANGNKLLSWRVELLRETKWAPLYAEFRLDEPWDSPHNRQLIAKMPKIYVTPGGSSPESSQTAYLAPYGKEFVFGADKAYSLHDLTAGDGASRTVALVEVDPEYEVEWTRPADLEVEPLIPTIGLGDRRGGGFFAAFFDGKVRFLKNHLHNKVIAALFTPEGHKTGEDHELDPLPFE